MLVSRSGEIKMLGPITIQPYDKYQHDPRISFHQAGEQWGLLVQSNDELPLGLGEHSSENQR